MPMEKHKCKLCSRTFINGKALGGHMKAHFSTFLLPSRPPHRTFSPELEVAEIEEEDDEEEGETSMIYGLRENPKKSLKLSDPIVQDRGSETESKSPTRRRSKRKRRLENWEKLSKPISDYLPAEQEPASCVSDASPEENVAMCLVLLSRDKWVGKEEEKGKALMEMKSRKVEGKNRCRNCMKAFRSSRALWSHKKICLRTQTELKNGGNGRIFECPFCCKVFGSGQALGGHKSSHLMASASNSVKTGLSFIDLNLPAPMEEDDYSVVSDA